MSEQRRRGQSTFWDDARLPMQESWRQIRGLRSDPPDRIKQDPQRQRMYSASLEQAEQQMRTAASVQYQSRPLNLFYSLSQAGRAVAAAREPRDDIWELRGHGITSNDDPGTLGQLRVGDKGKAGAFTVLARTLNSASLPSGAPLWELVQALVEPAMHDYTLNEDPTRPGLVGTTGSRGREAEFPHDVHLRVPVEEWTRDQLVEAYPDLRQAGARWEVSRQVTDEEGRNRTLLLDPSPDHPLRTYRGQKVLMPSIGGQPTTMHPLLIWWAVLHALSTLARYGPVAWGGLLDIDSSPVAPTLEFLLDTALDSVSEVIYDTLRGN